jgi:hypothetical protein
VKRIRTAGAVYWSNYSPGVTTGLRITRKTTTSPSLQPAMAAAALRPHLALLSGGGGIPNPALRTLSLVSPLLLHLRSHRYRGVLRSNASSSPPSPPPSPEKEAETVPTAESCVNLGLELFSKGRVREADSNAHFSQRSTDTGSLLCARMKSISIS